MAQRLTIEAVFAEAEAHGFVGFRVGQSGIEWGQPHGLDCPDCRRTRSRIKARYDEAAKYIRERKDPR